MSIDDFFYDSSDYNTDPGDEDGNQEDHLEKLDIETVAVGEWVKQAFIQAVLPMSVFEQRLSFRMFCFMKNNHNHCEIHYFDIIVNSWVKVYCEEEVFIGKVLTKVSLSMKIKCQNIHLAYVCSTRHRK